MSNLILKRDKWPPFPTSIIAVKTAAEYQRRKKYIFGSQENFILRN